MDNEIRKVFLPIGTGRFSNPIQVFLDNEKVYEGKLDTAPEEIKKLKYSKIILGNTITYYTFSDLN